MPRWIPFRSPRRSVSPTLPVSGSTGNPPSTAKLQTCVPKAISGRRNERRRQLDHSNKHTHRSGSNWSGIHSAWVTAGFLVGVGLVGSVMSLVGTVLLATLRHLTMTIFYALLIVMACFPILVALVTLMAFVSPDLVVALNDQFQYMWQLLQKRSYAKRVMEEESEADAFRTEVNDFQTEVNDFQTDLNGFRTEVNGFRNGGARPLHPGVLTLTLGRFVVSLDMPSVFLHFRSCSRDNDCDFDMDDMDMVDPYNPFDFLYDDERSAGSF